MYSHFTRGFTVRKSNFRLRKMYFHNSHFPLLKSQSCESAEGPAVAGCCCWAAMHSNHSKTVKWDSHFTLHFFQMWTVNRTWTVNFFFWKNALLVTRRRAENAYGAATQGASAELKSLSETRLQRETGNGANFTPRVVKWESAAVRQRDVKEWRGAHPLNVRKISC